MEALLIPLAAVICIFGIPIVAILTSHWQKMAEMKLRMRQTGDSTVLAEIRELKRQLDALRDTSTQYDMSFDKALQRIDSRVLGLEGRLKQVEEGRVSQTVGEPYPR